MTNLLFYLGWLLVLSLPFMLLFAPCVICRLSSTVVVSFRRFLVCVVSSQLLVFPGWPRSIFPGAVLFYAFCAECRLCSAAARLRLSRWLLNVVFHPQLRLASCVAHGPGWCGPHSCGCAITRCIRLLAFHEGGQKPRRGSYYGGGCRYSLLCPAPPTAFLPSLWAGRG